MEAICANCKKTIQADSKFCHHCGKENPGEPAERKCVHCDQAIATDAVFCPNCGKEQNMDQSTGMLDLSCKKCGSDNVKKLSIAYAEGLSIVNLKHSGAGIGIGSGGIGIGIGGGDTKGTNQTLWSERLSPPSTSNLSIVFGIAAIVVFIISIALVSTSIIITITGIVFGLLFWYFSNDIYKDNKKKRLEISKWDSTYVCLRCGERFLSEKQYADSIGLNWEAKMLLEKQHS